MRIARRQLFILLTGLLALAGALSSRPAHAASAEDFGKMPLFGGAAISPDGKYIAMKTNIEGKYYFQIFRMNGLNLERTFVGDTSDLQVRWMEWASPTRILVSVGKAQRRNGVPVTETRLIATNFDGSDMRDMIKQDRNDTQVQIQDNVISFLPDDPQHIIMAYNPQNPSRPRAQLVDIYSGKGRTLKGGQNDVYDWFVDRQGNVRISWGRDEDIWTFKIRNHDDDNWRILESGQMGSTKDFTVFGFARNPDHLYVGSNHEGGPLALYLYDVRAGKYMQKVFGHPTVDIAVVDWNENTWQPMRITYVLDGVHHLWKDPVYEARYNAMKQSLPGYSIRIIDVSADGRTWLIEASSTTKPGGYYIYSEASKQLISFGPNYPQLAGAPMSNMIPFNYKARDGLTIPAYLSLPKGSSNVEAAKDLPLVVMPHGGPAGRDYLGFDPFLQMLTNSGYAVLQMNFRGSWGYGAEFKSAGYGEWGGKMQDDVTDGVNFLVSQGIADPNRVCIFGISYGGYAALMGAVKTPTTYKCAVGVNGVYDLRKMIRDEFVFVGRGSSQYWQAVIGKYSEKDLLESISPEARAGEIQIPVLLVASDDDRVVRSSQSSDMANALKRNKKNVEFLELESGGHSLTVEESRVEFMRTLDKFLAKHLR